MNIKYIRGTAQKLTRHNFCSKQWFDPPCGLGKYCSFIKLAFHKYKLNRQMNQRQFISKFLS